MSNSIVESQQQEKSTKAWKAIFSGNNEFLNAKRQKHLGWPKDPRCLLCAVPFAGIGGLWFFLWRVRRNSRNEHYCNECDTFIRNNVGGAEINLSMIMVDIRDSVAITDPLSPLETHRLRSSFYNAAAEPIIETGGLLHELTGDSVFGVYPPGFCGDKHASKAAEAARRLLSKPALRAPDGSSIRIGIGVHTGPVYIGKAIGVQGGIQDVALHGRDTNVVGRLSQVAGADEALISRQTCEAAGLDLSCADVRTLELKGISEPMRALVLRRA